MAKRISFGVFVLLLASALLFAPRPARSAQTAGPSCCQCPLPSCGPPVNGRCSSECKLITNATCNGRTGRCQVITAFDPPAQDGDASRVSSVDDPVLNVNLQLPEVVR